MSTATATAPVISIHDRPGATVISLTAYTIGEAEYGTVIGHLGYPFERCEQPNHILDLSEVEYLNTVGANYLVRIHDYLVQKDGTVRLVVTEPLVLHVLERLGVDRIFAIHPSLDKALADCRA